MKTNIYNSIVILSECLGKYHGPKNEKIGHKFHFTGAGTTAEPKTYRYEDSSPLKGINYYRLQQIDGDGVQKVLGEVAVNFSFAVQESAAYPNPTGNKVTIKIAEGDYKEARLFTVDGRELKRIPISNQDQEVSFDLEKLSPGVYMVNLYGAEKKVLKVIRE